MSIRTTIYKTVNSKYGKISNIYDGIMILAIIIGIIPLLTRESSYFFIALDVISCLLFSIDYILRWLTCDIGSKRNPVVSFLIYPFTFMAIIDLLSIIPTLGLLNPSLKLFRISRLLKILRVFKFFRYYKPMRLMSNVLRKESRTLLTVFGFAVFYIFVTALIMFNSEKAIDPETGEYIFSSFFDALYWAACTLTTVGYGDICPASNLGRLISMISAIAGVAIIALPSSIITASYMDELRKWDEQEEKKLAKKETGKKQ